MKSPRSLAKYLRAPGQSLDWVLLFLAGLLLIRVVAAIAMRSASV